VLRTLKAVTGERPRCQCCDKPLRPDTSTVELPGHLAEAPAEATFLAEHAFEREHVFRLQHRTTYRGDLITILSFWRGTYGGCPKSRTSPRRSSTPCCPTKRTIAVASSTKTISSSRTSRRSNRSLGR
jgi:hypothetical protein